MAKKPTTPPSISSRHKSGVQRKAAKADKLKKATDEKRFSYRADQKAYEAKVKKASDARRQRDTVARKKDAAMEREGIARRQRLSRKR
jgi:hypothetical protein